MCKIQILHYFNTKTPKALTDIIFNQMKKKCRWHHHQRISKRNVKQVISPLGGHSWGLYGCQKKQKSSRKLNLFVWYSTFQSKFNKLWKTTIKSSFLKGFCVFFQIVSAWITQMDKRNGILAFFKLKWLLSKGRDP